MPRSSKLARRMKLKKKIEEEFRVAEVRRNVGRVSIYEEYWDRAEVQVGRGEGKGGREDRRAKEEDEMEMEIHHSTDREDVCMKSAKLEKSK